MTTPQKIIVATALAAAIGVSIYQARQASLLRAQINTLQQELASPSEPAKQAVFAALQKKVEGLETQNGELSRALSQANADKARLQAEREQARRSTALYKGTRRASQFAKHGRHQ
jgi:predicted RNase H-like nuclease (RuvC/YqgF family)